jgi:glycine cleavage system H protein
MTQLRYTKDHEYIRVDADGAAVGVSVHAQSQLGDVVFVELPEVGATFAQGAEAAVVESVKAASEVYAPASGEVVAVNNALESEPSLINEDPTGKGWIFRLKLANPTELDALMDEAAYLEFVKSLG